jgi:biotin carboxyl carrier protein
LEYEFFCGKDLHKIYLKNKDRRFVALIGDEQLEVDIHSISANELSLLISNRSFKIFLAKDGPRLHVAVNGENYCLLSADEEEGVMTGQADVTGHVEAKFTITAPMPGNVLKINVEEGEEIGEGQCLAIVEAMKMETGLHSQINGRIKKIYAEQGQQVNAGETLIELEEISSE